jgi:hypothetical protein
MRFVIVAVAATAMAVNCAVADDVGSSKLQGDALKKAVAGKTINWRRRSERCRSGFV